MLSWRRRLAVVSTTTALAAACSDEPSPTALEQAQRLHAANSTLVATDTTWDYFRADYTLIFEGGARTGHPIPPPRAMQMRVERSLRSDRTWATTISFPPSPNKGRLRRPLAASTVSDSAGVRMLDATGRLIELPEAVRAHLPKQAAPTRAPSRQHQSDSRDWLDNVVVRPGASDRVRERLGRSMGLPVSRDGSRSTYRAARGDRTTEFVLNGAYAGNTQTIWFTNEGGPFTVDVVITDNNSQTATASLSVGIQPGAPCMY